MKFISQFKIVVDVVVVSVVDVLYKYCVGVFDEECLQQELSGVLLCIEKLWVDYFVDYWIVVEKEIIELLVFILEWVKWMILVYDEQVRVGSL